MKTEEIKGKNSKGELVTYLVKKPTSLDYQKAKMYSNRIGSQIANQVNDDGTPAFLIREKVYEILTKMGVWNKDLEKELIDISTKINEAERKLAKGGIKKSEGREIALSIKRLRERQLQILAKSRLLDDKTLEAQIDNANFDYLVFSCTLDEEGNPIYSSVEDYKENGSDEVTVKCATRLAEMLYGYSEEDEKNQPENKFLLKYGFVDSNLRLINKDGKFVDEQGRLINEDGRLINEDGKFVDREGKLVDEDGAPIDEEFVEFIDD